MKNQGREGGLQTRPWVSIRWGRGGGATNETMDLCEGVVGSQQIPWLSTGGGGGATEETVGLYRGEGGYRRDQGSLPGGSWVTADTMGLYKGEGGGKTDTMGLLKGVGGYKRTPSSPLILVGPELV